MGAKLGLSHQEKHRRRVLEDRALRRIFGPKGEEVAGGCRRLHNEMGGTRSTYGENERCVQNFDQVASRDGT
jgi:hypothetical protein